MLERSLFVFVLVCAAVMSFIMCSDAARASPITTQVDKGVKSNVLRRLYTPTTQHRPVSAGLRSTETGLQTGTNSETETSGNHREALLVTGHQSIPLRFTEDSFGYNQNSPDNRLVTKTKAQSGVRPASSILTSRTRTKSSVNSYPFYQKVAQKSYNLYPVIIRKSSLKEAAGPFHQSSSASQVWDPKDAQKTFNEEKIHRSDSPKVADDKTVQQPSYLFSPQTSRHRSTSLPTSRGHYNGYKETNELVAARARSTSSGIQSSKFLGFASQTAPRAPSISNSLDASVIKSNPSPEKPTPSITDFSQGGSSETPRRKKVQSYLFKDSQTSFGGRERVNTVPGDGFSAFSKTPYKQRPSDVHVYGRVSSNNANVVQYGAQTDSFTKHQRTTAEALSQISLHPSPGTDDTRESFVPTPRGFQGNYATGSEKSVVSSLVNASTRGLMHAFKPGQTVKSIYGFRGFEHPTWRGVKESPILSSGGSNERADARRYANIYPSLSPKYSFGHREAAKLLLAPTASLNIVQTMTTSRPFTSGFKEARPLLPESDAGMDSNPGRRQFTTSRRIYGLKGFGTPPLEGAKPLVSEPDQSARVQQGFEAFKHSSWQPKGSRVHRWHNQTGETKASGIPIISSVYLRPAENLSVESSPRSESNKTIPAAKKASLLYGPTSSTVRGKRVQQRKHKKLNESAPRTNEAGNAAIVRLPKRPARVNAITYADILGSASFSGVRATTQTPITPADKDYSPNTTATNTQKEGEAHWAFNSEDTVHSRDNTSRGPEAHAEDQEEDVSSVEENKLVVRSEDADMKTSDLFLDNEGSGSGSGDFNMSDVLSTDATKSQGLSEDLLELDYLQISTGNITFKSMNLSHTEK